MPNTGQHPNLECFTKLATHQMPEQTARKPDYGDGKDTD